MGCFLGRDCVLRAGWPVLSCGVRRSIGFGILALALASCSGKAPPKPQTALPAHRSVPLAVVEFSGHRYITRADIGPAHGVPLMVHGNASMYLALTHRVGAKVNGGPVPRIADYGFSTRGKGEIGVDSIWIGGDLFRGQPKVPVFDFTEDGDTLVQGMLGVPFLVRARAAVDFMHDQLLLGVSGSAEPDSTLLLAGYRWVVFSISPDERTTLEARFPAIRRTIPITPSTVSNSLTLHLPLFARRVTMRKAASPDRSPNGTTPDEFSSDSVGFEIAGVRMASSATFENLAEYGKVTEGSLKSYGMLGFDWMKQHGAVLDYSNRRLYFKP